MKAETRLEVTVTLKLSEEEAQWLKSKIQNPLCDAESVEDSRMRQELWDALKDVALVNYGKAEDIFNAKQAEIGGMPYGTYGGCGQ